MKKLIILSVVATILLVVGSAVTATAQAGPIFHRVEKGETFWGIAKLYHGNGSLGLKLHDRFIKSGAGWIYDNGPTRHDESDDFIRPIRPEELQINTLLFIPKLKAVLK